MKENKLILILAGLGVLLLAAWKFIFGKRDKKEDAPGADKETYVSSGTVSGGSADSIETKISSGYPDFYETLSSTEKTLYRKARTEYLETFKRDPMDMTTEDIMLRLDRYKEWKRWADQYQELSGYALSYDNSENDEIEEVKALIAAYKKKQIEDLDAQEKAYLDLYNQMITTGDGTTNLPATMIPLSLAKKYFPDTESLSAFANYLLNQFHYFQDNHLKLLGGLLSRLLGTIWFSKGFMNGERMAKREMVAWDVSVLNECMKLTNDEWAYLEQSFFAVYANQRAYLYPNRLGVGKTQTYGNQHERTKVSSLLSTMDTTRYPWIKGRANYNYATSVFNKFKGSVSVKPSPWLVPETPQGGEMLIRIFLGNEQ